MSHFTHLPVYAVAVPNPPHRLSLSLSVVYLVGGTIMVNREHRHSTKYSRPRTAEEQ